MCPTVFRNGSDLTGLKGRKRATLQIILTIICGKCIYASLVRCIISLTILKKLTGSKKRTVLIIILANDEDVKEGYQSYHMTI